MDIDDRDILLTAAERIERLAASATSGDWRTGGLLATRPEVIAHRSDGSTEHVAEARAGSARWIAAFSPELAGPLADWLRSTSDDSAVEFARAVLRRLPG
ncbi:hypothetical protein [Saccharopolyspora rosea]|uniref:Uncharacterized protein n=1 Tax=Saccharopolyspora rosea TaxID=524884 RepID=A0ABW3G0A1_9PSEU|nr:hypothetical protein [Saccharopolyspora rosea]